MSEHTKATPEPWYADDSGNIYGAGGRLVANCGGFYTNRGDSGR